MLHVFDQLEISSNIEVVFDSIWRPELWVRITPHVKKIHILEETNDFQRFEMNIESEGVLHNLETIRHSLVNRFIKYEQKKPPALLKYHSGKWSFYERKESTLLTLDHEAEINWEKARDMLKIHNDDQAIEDHVRQKLLENGRLTMYAVKLYLETDTAR